MIVFTYVHGGLLGAGTAPPGPCEPLSNSFHDRDVVAKLFPEHVGSVPVDDKRLVRNGYRLFAATGKSWQCTDVPTGSRIIQAKYVVVVDIGDTNGSRKRFSGASGAAKSSLVIGITSPV